MVLTNPSFSFVLCVQTRKNAKLLYLGIQTRCLTIYIKD